MLNYPFRSVASFNSCEDETDEEGRETLEKKGTMIRSEEEKRSTDLSLAALSIPPFPSLPPSVRVRSFRSIFLKMRFSLEWATDSQRREVCDPVSLSGVLYVIPCQFVQIKRTRKICYDCAKRIRQIDRLASDWLIRRVIYNWVLVDTVLLPDIS